MIVALNLLGLPATSAKSALRADGCVFSESMSPLGDEVFLEAPSSGISLNIDSRGIVDAIHLYKRGLHGYSEFCGQLPNGISFSETRSQIQEKLGTPTICSDASPSVFGAAAWDRYDSSSLSLHVQYQDHRGTPVLITLMLPSRAP